MVHHISFLTLKANEAAELSDLLTRFFNKYYAKSMKAEEINFILKAKVFFDNIAFDCEVSRQMILDLTAGDDNALFDNP